ncbi:MAG: cytochrome-c oxidase, cbb3-type subunit II, partial [Gammaproteobacteria bacterium]|nr:cytochrome-c oxidase, cbb3-type subunit II [Gammaproteobacteria bacterium]
MADKIHSTKLQDKVERSAFVMLGMLLILLSIGGLVEIVPLFYLDETMEHNQHPEIVWQRKDGQTLADWQAGDGVRPYKPVELEGRAIYIREGCYLCHSQMIRPFRDEKERYGHYSLASESMYDHPFQWGSKRTGPDLARVGAKYSDDWHIRHLRAPRSVVPESVMPSYPWLEKNRLDAEHTVG